MASRLVDPGQAGTVRVGVDQQMMLVQSRDQGRQPTGGYPGGGRSGIQGVDVQAAVKTLHNGDLGVTEPVQDDSGVGAHAELE
jgi:hypothetical protein